MSSQLKIFVTGGSSDERLALATFLQSSLEYAHVKYEVDVAAPAPTSLRTIQQASVFAPVKIGVQDDEHELEAHRIV